jgi:aldehyde dehydrogenase (NAD+)
MIQESNPRDIKEVFDGCKSAFDAGVTRSVEWRQNQLIAVEKMLNEQEDTFVAALAKDLGKSETEAWLLEISFVQLACQHARKHLPRWMRDRRVQLPVIAMPGRSWVKPEPLGCVLNISPWNYPLQLCLAPLVSSISAGNCTVLKPSESAPATSAALAKLIPQYLDQDCIKVVEGGVETATNLLELDWDHIVFTGSETVGKIVLAAAAKHLTPVTLELGGKSPCIVLPDANLDVAARRITWGCFTNAGQTCIAPDYILTDPQTAELLIPKLRREINLMFGDDAAKSKDYGRIVNSAHFDRLISLIGNDHVVIGGKSNRDDLFISPTVLHPVSENSPSMQSEIFGPLLPVLEVSGLDEAIKFIRSRAKPLAAYLFGGNAKAKTDMTEQVSAGSVCINDVMIFMGVADLPFGGVGASGIGQYNGKYGFNNLSHLKACLRRSFWPDLQLRYAPSSRTKLKWLRWLR